MPIYAVLGATGNTGQSLLQVLTKDSANTIHAYCRSKPKLERLSPETVTNPNFKVFEGSLSNVAVIRDCIKDAHAVFLAVAVSGNVPGNTIAQDTSSVVVKALQELRDTEPSRKLPRLVILSAAPTEPDFTKDMPAFALGLLLRAESNIYNDLIAAEKILRKEQEWLSATFVKPGALTIDAQKGHALTFEGPGPVVSFQDCAAAMVEVAESGDSYDWKSVSVKSLGKDVQFPWRNIPLLVKGTDNPVFSTTAIFDRVARQDPQCGDCLTKLLLNRVEQGLSPLLPNNQADIRYRETILKALKRYSYVIVGPDALFTMVTDAEQVQIRLIDRLADPKKQSGQLCLNDDVVSSDETELLALRETISRLFNEHWGTPSQFEA